ncbi:MAG: Multidrug resistance protein Stp [Chlamydiia bacterium]|nr:Multidrug resistance protein Stp [Chlamydiia bacterium]MCH9616028.1 Multidrug resistance protein Stp [Chlamydiia bacterium]MCH9629051.1 Multidrug resistance protein Stp [Chlamydiia bacterium]
MKNFLGLIAVSGAYAIVYLDMSFVNIALPSIQATFGSTTVQMHWFMTMYILAVALFAFTSGKIADMTSYKGVYLVGTSVFILGSLMCAFASSTERFMGTRFIQGFGAAFMLPASLALIYKNAKLAERGSALGWYSFFAASCLVAGPFLGGLIVEYLGWRSVFLIIAALGAVLLLFTISFTTDYQSEHAYPFDWVGQILLFISLLGLISEGYKTTIVAALCFLLFIVYEWRRPYPLIDLRMLASRNFAVAALNFFFAQMLLFANVFFAIHLQKHFGYSPIIAGLLLLPSCAFAVTLNIPAGRFTDRRGAKPVLLTGIIISLLGFMCLTLFHRDYLQLLPGFILYSISLPLIFVPNYHLILHAVPEGMQGSASGIAFGFRHIGGLLGFATMSIVWTWGKFGGVMFFLGCIAILALLLTAIVARNKPHDGHTYQNM